ncbi:MAG TPA: hypothetical protein VHF88_04840 [Thermoleophilaceae bacterium]|nr:hypothetical protein [Thermoleophilaceae bacterium]
MALLLAPSAQAAKCPAKYSRADFHRIAAKAYDGRQPTTRHERRTLARVVRCQKRPRASRTLIRDHRGRWRRRHLRGLELRSIAPYSCGRHGRFAVPCSIVERESRYSWSAYNASSGALGPYQFLGWRVPWPVRTASDRLAHHRMAARLWSGGAGASHWGGW